MAKKKNEKVSRRDFLKKSATLIIPSLAVMGLGLNNCIRPATAIIYALADVLAHAPMDAQKPALAAAQESPAVLLVWVAVLVTVLAAVLVTALAAVVVALTVAVVIVPVIIAVMVTVLVTVLMIVIQTVKAVKLPV